MQHAFFVDNLIGDEPRIRPCGAIFRLEGQCGHAHVTAVETGIFLRQHIRPHIAVFTLPHHAERSRSWPAVAHEHGRGIFHPCTVIDVFKTSYGIREKDVGCALCLQMEQTTIA